MWQLGNGNKGGIGGTEAGFTRDFDRAIGSKLGQGDLGMAGLKTGGFKCSWEKSGKTSRGWGDGWIVGRLQWRLRAVKRPLNPRAAIGDDADLF